MSKRLQAMGSANYKNGFKLTLHEKALELPASWKKPQNIFVNSMSDLFHEAVPEDYILRIFEIMKAANWHQFQILTKRAERLYELNESLNWCDNIWMGVSVENADYEFRVDYLRKTGAKIKFISFEPLIGPCGKLNLNGIDWVIVGGESGPRSRPIEQSWVIQIRDQCLDSGIPFFFKQWGGFNKKKNGRLLEGRIWDGMPAMNSAP